MADTLKGKRVAFLVANEGVEQVELTDPWKAIRAAGGDPELIAPEPGQIQAFNHLDKGDRFDLDKTVDEADPSGYDALVLPGGVANPDTLRTIDQAVAFARSFFEEGKPVGVICHGPWTLVEADVVRGRSSPRGRASRPTSGIPAARGSETGGGRGSRARQQPLAGRPAGVQLEDRRGIRGGRPRGAKGGHGRRLRVVTGAHRNRGAPLFFAVNGPIW